MHDDMVQGMRDDVGQGLHDDVGQGLHDDVVQGLHDDMVQGYTATGFKGGRGQWIAGAATTSVREVQRLMVRGAA
jgi:hypothetical protein